MPTPFDYDREPERFRLASRVTREHLTGTPSLYARIAEVLAGVGTGPVLDVGCGEGALRAALPARRRPLLVGLDASRTMLAAHPPPVVLADPGAVRDYLVARFVAPERAAAAAAQVATPLTVTKRGALLRARRRALPHQRRRRRASASAPARS